MDDPDNTGTATYIIYNNNTGGQTFTGLLQTTIEI